ncbi:MAG: DUF1292 domain-containing protein [Clostridiales bacterium]|jgi:hypothetical protein|nr:DUF1292 domain-containing protein [Clostridiales bacterium]
MKQDKDFNIENEDDLEGMEVVTLYDAETQKEIDFEEICAIEHEGKWYVCLTPIEESDEIEEGSVIMMEAAEDADGEETLLPVADEALLNTLFEKLQEEIGECGDDCEECDCGCGAHEHKGCDCGCGCGDEE